MPHFLKLRSNQKTKGSAIAQNIAQPGRMCRLETQSRAAKDTQTHSTIAHTVKILTKMGLIP